MPSVVQQLTVILDGSFSMSGKKIETTKKVFDQLIKNLFRTYGPTAYFQVIFIYVVNLRLQYLGLQRNLCGNHIGHFQEKILNSL